MRLYEISRTRNLEAAIVTPLRLFCQAPPRARVATYVTNGRVDGVNPRIAVVNNQRSGVWTENVTQLLGSG